MTAPFQVAPPLTDEERDALRASIEEHGQLVPILCAADGTVIDGHNREAICRELGIEPVYSYGAPEWSDEQKRTLAYESNSNRRHMSCEQRRWMAERSLLADPGLSNRQHAQRTGVSHPAVAKLRANLEFEGRLETVTSRVGGDGRRRPATQPAPKPNPKPAPAVRERTTRETFTCGLCGELFATKPDCQAHYDTEHAEPEPVEAVERPIPGPVRMATIGPEHYTRPVPAPDAIPGVRFEADGGITASVPGRAERLDWEAKFDRVAKPLRAVTADDLWPTPTPEHTESLEGLAVSMRLWADRIDQLVAESSHLRRLK